MLVKQQHFPTFREVVCPVAHFLPPGTVGLVVFLFNTRYSQIFCKYLCSNHKLHKVKDGGPYLTLLLLKNIISMYIYIYLYLYIFILYYIYMYTILYYTYIILYILFYTYIILYILYYTYIISYILYYKKYIFNYIYYFIYIYYIYIYYIYIHIVILLPSPQPADTWSVSPISSAATSSCGDASKRWTRSNGPRCWELLRPWRSSQGPMVDVGWEDHVPQKRPPLISSANHYIQLW